MPITNAPRNTYGRAFFSVWRDTRPVQTMTMITIGTWNARPNANTMPSVKLKNALMSVMTLTPSGAVVAKNSNTIGSTTKNANATPT